MRHSEKPSENMRHVTLKRLIQIRENNYASKYYDEHYYCKKMVDKEIERKLAKHDKQWCENCSLIYITSRCIKCGGHFG